MSDRSSVVPVETAGPLESVQVTQAARAQRGASRRRSWLRVTLAVLALVIAVAGVAGVLGYRFVHRVLATEPYPERATGLRAVGASSAAHELVVVADPQAARAAEAMLARGGSAIDAALAAQLVLGLVEPQSSGLGGGAFLLYWDAHTNKLQAYDGREIAPAAVDRNLFMREGQALSFPRALVGGRSVGVPGVLRMLELAHADHGRLPWQAAFDDATRLAREGFRVSARLAKLVSMDPVLPTLMPTRGFFAPEGVALAAGERVVNAAYADTLASIAEHGADALYTGRVADDITRAVHSARQPSMARGLANIVLGELGLPMSGEAQLPAPGALARADLAGYRALRREALCVRYRAYRVCGMPPPASGVTVLEALALLERFPIASYAPLSADALHLLAEVQRVAFADRDAWLSDPAFSAVPVSGLLQPDYVRARSAQITLQHALGAVKAGVPEGAHVRYEPARSPELPATSHLTIVDREGDVVSMTSSIEFAFGSHVMVDGFLLNNQLTDFSFRPERDGKLVANAVAPGKRPRSAMSPTLIFDAATGKPIAALGSPGGPAIVGYVVQAIVALLDWKLSPQDAVALPHVINRNRKTELEDVGWPNTQARDAAVHALEARGHEVDVGQQNSGLHVIWIGDAELQGGVDPRREGAAIGR